ncbi:terminase small subunit [Emticicia agri]|uniref:DNA-packaging protein n=1 Tax=Emticicia agri TaxID=2492393 RepID=A0A4Q5LTW3_9BACT|nr:terminase small subunit [Emticicia agri]RYU93012.1 DNA-packaging protein [Emticicia agri]
MTEKEYYRLRSVNGQDRVYKTPKALITACNAYFAWCLDNPILEEKVFQHQGRPVSADIRHTRPFTLEGLCNHIDISLATFKSYEEQAMFKQTAARIRQIIDNQQFEGVAAGILNANIIARKLGLVDKKDHTTGGESLNRGFFDFLRETSVAHEDE